jgi:hypothetical protein
MYIVGKKYRWKYLAGNLVSFCGKETIVTSEPREIRVKTELGVVTAILQETDTILKGWPVAAFPNQLVPVDEEEEKWREGVVECVKWEP